MGGQYPEMNSVLITGGTGTLGHGLVERLLQSEVGRICIISRGEKAQADMARKFPDDRVRFFIGDVRDRWRLRRAMDGCEVVIHAAALKRIEVGVYNPDEMVKTNVLGTANVIEGARGASVNKVVLVSSDKAFADLVAAEIIKFGEPRNCVINIIYKSGMPVPHPPLVLAVSFIRFPAVFFF